MKGESGVRMRLRRNGREGYEKVNRESDEKLKTKL